MHTVSILCLAAMTAHKTVADTHYLYAGYFSEASVSGIEFDDEANTLTLMDNFSVTSGSSRWIAADVRMKMIPVVRVRLLILRAYYQNQLQNLYIAGDGIYQSYTINSDKSLTFTGANVSDTTSCTLSVSLALQHKSPGTIFGVSYDAGCSGVAISVDSSGALVSQIANLTYDTSAGIHGLAISPDSQFVYSADDMGSRVWAHSYDGDTTLNYSSVTGIQELAGSGARHLVVHPNGNWLYVVYESANEIAVYSRDATTGELTNTNETYSLLPDGFTNSSSYWSSDVSVSNSSSTSPKYLFGFVRSRDDSINGWVNGFALDAETGAISERIFVEEANGFGGTTNSITPSSFSEEYFAVTDEGDSFVEVWQIADNASSASAVAHLDLEAGPVNVVWYS